MPSKLYSIDRTYDMHKLFHVIEHSKPGLDLIFMFKIDSHLYLNSSNLQILKALAKETGRVLKFEVENNNHLDYIDAVNNDNLTFSPTSIDLADPIEMQVEKSKKQFFKVPKMGFAFKKKQKSIPDVVFTEVQKDVGKFKLKFLTFVIVFFVVIGLLGTGFWALIYYLPRATVKLKLDSETLINLVDIKAKTDVKEVNAAEGIIPATTLDVEETDSATIDTTGEKEIGDFATGEITVYNKTDKEIRIKKNITVKLKKDSSKDNEALNYLTLEEVKIPPKEQKEVPTTLEDGTTQVQQADVFGSKIIKIKASKYGPEYNLDKKQKFEISGFKYDAEVYGENENNIKGGSVDKVNSVTESDLRTVRKTLEDVLRAKAIEDLKKKVISGQNLQEASITIDPVKEEYSNKAEEVADKLTLKLTVKATGLAYSEDNLKLAIKEMIKKVVPESFKLTGDDDFDYEVAVLKNNKEPTTITLQVKLKSYVTPKINEDEIKSNLAGMKVADAQTYLAKVKNVKEYQIELRPKLPAALVSMPHKPENIKVEIVR